MWEHFKEDDDRANVGKVLCTPDPGPSSVAGVPTNATTRAFLSVGCLSAPLNTRAAFGTPNTLATSYGILAYQAVSPRAICSPA